MFGKNVLDKVKVQKTELLSKMKDNREQHQKDVQELLVSRNEETKEYFSSLAEKLASSPEFQPKENIKFPLPVDNTGSYDRAIKMVEMSVDDEIELTEDQFDKLVMDNWEWKSDFLTTSQFYGKAK